MRVDEAAVAVVVVVVVYGFATDFLVYGLDTAAAAEEVVGDDLAYGLATVVAVDALAYGFATGVFFAYGLDDTADGMEGLEAAAAAAIDDDDLEDPSTSSFSFLSLAPNASIAAFVPAMAFNPKLCIRRASNSNLSVSENVDFFHSLKYITNP